MVQRTSDEGGATAVLVAILLVVFFGAAAIAVDLGAGWDTKRDLVPDTDAAALAAAQTAATLGCDEAKTAAAEYLAANLGQPVSTATLDLPGNVWLCGDGTVTVGVTQTQDNVFAQVVGADDELQVFASSTAAFTNGAGGGLRPIAACLFDTEIQNWLAGGDGSSYKFSLGGGATNCGSAPGNWGWTCFDREHGPYVSDGPSACDGNNGQPRIDTMLEHGYNGVVDLGEHPTVQSAPDEDCVPDTADLDRCDGTPGSLGNSTSGALQYLLDTGITFPILGIGDWAGNGAGANVSPVAFIGVRVVDYRVTGKKDNRFIEFELVNIFEEGTSAVQLGGRSGVTEVSLCGVDDIIDVCDS